MNDSVKLRQERAKLIEDMRTLNRKAEDENRNLNTEEQASYDKMLADVTSLKQRYERMEREEELVKEITQKREGVDPLLNGRSTGTVIPGDPTSTPEYRAAFAQYIRTADPRVFRDLNTTTPGDGGYYVPVQLATDVVKELLRGSTVRRAGARVLSTGVRTTIPITTNVTGTWEPERDPYGNNADTDPTFSVFNAVPRKYTMRTTISEELFNDSTIDIEGLVRSLFVDAYAQAADDAYVDGAGSGSNQPTGVFPGAGDYVVTSATAYTVDELKGWFHALPSQYRSHPSCAVIASDKFIGQVAALAVDPSNGILFDYATVAGEPDRFMNKPIYSSSVVDVTYVASAELAVIGAFNFYQIVDFTKYSMVKRLSELSALSGAENIIARFATDGKVLVQSAFKTLKLAAS